MNAEKEIPFNEEFCSILEYKLSQAFKNSGEEDLMRFWCDGISHEAEPLSRLSIKALMIREE